MNGVLKQAIEKGVQSSVLSNADLNLSTPFKNATVGKVIRLALLQMNDFHSSTVLNEFFFLFFAFEFVIKFL